jgi:hypothetical protein
MGVGEEYVRILDNPTAVDISNYKERVKALVTNFSQALQKKEVFWPRQFKANVLYRQERSFNGINLAALDT